MRELLVTPVNTEVGCVDNSVPSTLETVLATKDERVQEEQNSYP